jgi:hypothetical protein
MMMKRRMKYQFLHKKHNKNLFNNNNNNKNPHNNSNNNNKHQIMKKELMKYLYVVYHMMQLKTIFKNSSLNVVQL